MPERLSLTLLPEVLPYQTAVTSGEGWFPSSPEQSRLRLRQTAKRLWSGKRKKGERGRETSGLTGRFFGISDDHWAREAQKQRILEWYILNLNNPLVVQNPTAL